MSTATSITPRAMAAGMAAAAATGVGIGVLLPAHLLTPRDPEPEETPSDEIPVTTREDSIVHEDIANIAEDIPRPAIIQDATRNEVEALYEFHSCIASGASATVWRATEIATGKQVAIKVGARERAPPDEACACVCACVRVRAIIYTYIHI